MAFFLEIGVTVKTETQFYFQRRWGTAASVVKRLTTPVAWLQAGPPQWTLSAGLVVLYLGIVVSGIAHMLFSMGLRHISGPTGVALSLNEPIAAFLLSVWVVGEHQPIVAWIGLLVVLGGLLLVIGAEMRSSRLKSPVTTLA